MTVVRNRPTGKCLQHQVPSRLSKSLDFLRKTEILDDSKVHIILRRQMTEILALFMSWRKEVWGEYKILSQIICGMDSRKFLISVPRDG